MGRTTRSVVSAAKSVSSKKKSAKEKKKRDATWESSSVGSGSQKLKVLANKRRGGTGGRFAKKVPTPAPAGWSSQCALLRRCPFADEADCALRREGLAIQGAERKGGVL